VTRPIVVGVDPGPVPGVALISQFCTVDVLQVSPDTLLPIVRALVDTAAMTDRQTHAVLAVEKFVVGRRATRSATPKAGELVRNQVGALEALAGELRIPVFLRSASDVKPWASDARLESVGAYVSGMPHGRDAARHALFCSVHDAGFPDPLSSRSPRGA